MLTCASSVRYATPTFLSFCFHEPLQHARQQTPPHSCSVQRDYNTYVLVPFVLFVMLCASYFVAQGAACPSFHRDVARCRVMSTSPDIGRHQVTAPNKRAQKQRICTPCNSIC